jgi:hypothetical protein
MLACLLWGRPTRASDTIVIWNSWGTSYWPTERLNVFDDKVFDLSDADGPRSSRPGFDPRQPELYPEEREKIIERCAPLKEKSFRKFRNCYQQGKREALKRYPLPFQPRRMQ